MVAAFVEAEVLVGEGRGDAAGPRMAKDRERVPGPASSDRPLQRPLRIPRARRNEERPPEGGRYKG